MTKFTDSPITDDQIRGPNGQASDDAKLEALRNFAVRHAELSFAHLVTCAINGERWAIERVNFVLGSIATITSADGPPADVKLAIIRVTSTARPPS